MRHPIHTNDCPRRARAGGIADWLSSSLALAASHALNALRLLHLPGHRRRVRASRRVLARLRSFAGTHAPGQCFAYLRQVDPLTFEEVVLSALEDAGAVVLRGRRYSGDGGVDGRFWLPGMGWRTAAVQSKRFGASVRPDAVSAFQQVLVANRHCAGLFVHCGRTGPLSWQAIAGSRVRVVSGDRLLRLLLVGELPLWRLA